MSIRQRLTRFRTLLILAVITIVILAGVVIITNRNRQMTLPAQTVETVQTRTVTRIVSVEGNLTGVADRSVYLPSQAKVTNITLGVGAAVNVDTVLATVQAAYGTGTRDVDVKSPITGTLAEVNVGVNDVVINPTQAAFRVIDSSSYVINVNVNENDMAGLSVDQPAQITLPAISLDTRYDGKVSYIAPAANAGAGAVTYLVKITPTTAPAGARPGMSADADITTAQVDNVLAVPDSYIIRRDNKFYVKLVQWQNSEHTSYVLQETEVELGLQTDSYDEIKSGLAEKDQIVEPSFTVQRQFGLF